MVYPGFDSRGLTNQQLNKMKKILLLLVLSISFVSCNKIPKPTDMKSPVAIALAKGLPKADFTLEGDLRCRYNETIKKYHPTADALCFQSFTTPRGEDSLGRKLVNYYTATFKRVDGVLVYVSVKKVKQHDALYPHEFTDSVK